MIQSLWVQQAESIIDVKLGDADADSKQFLANDGAPVSVGDNQ